MGAIVLKIEIVVTSRLVPKSLEALNGCSFRCWVRNIVLEINLDKPFQRRFDTAEAICLQVAKIIKYTTHILASGPDLDSLRILLHEKASFPPAEWTVKKSVLEASAPLYGRARNVEVNMDMENEVKGVRGEGIEDLALLRRSLQILPIQPAFFLAIPEEIRRMVYSQLMTVRYSDLLSNPFSTDDRPSHTFPSALLRTCRSVHDEASTYFYSNLTWNIRMNRWQAPRVPAKLVPRYSHMISHFEISINLLQSFGTMPRDLEEMSEEISRYGRIKTLQIHTIASGDANENPYNYLQGLLPLADRVDKVIIGSLMRDCRRDFGSDFRDEEAYRHLKQIFYRVEKWSFPYADHQYKD